MPGKDSVRQVPKELPSSWGEKANTHGHVTNYTRQCMLGAVFGGGVMPRAGKSRARRWGRGGGCPGLRMAWQRFSKWIGFRKAFVVVLCFVVADLYRVPDSTLEAEDNDKKTCALPSRRLSKLFQQGSRFYQGGPHCSGPRDTSGTLSPQEAELDGQGLGIQGGQSDAMS